MCIDDLKPASVQFQIIQWRRIRDHTIVGEVGITKDEMSVLMTQEIGFDMLVQLPLHRDGRQVLGSAGPCTLWIKLVVVADSTKTLLKYHPDVDINLQLDVEHLLETLSVKKSQLPLWRLAFLGLLSGVWMAISGCFAFAVAGECPDMLLTAGHFYSHVCDRFPADAQGESTRTSCAPRRF
jgi:hypothetical protein